MPGAYQYAEGGGPLPPYHESFLENIVGVSWQSTGGVFVSGDFCCFERAVSIPKAGAAYEWIGLGSLDFGDGGGTFSSTYAKVNGEPIFLIGGHGGQSGMGLIMRSNDGFQWETVLHSNTIQHISGLVWEAAATERNNDGVVTISGKGLFYADQSNGRCLYSPDGKLWYYAYSAFEAHCKGVIPGVPDGVYGYNPSIDLLMFGGGSPFIGDFLNYYDLRNVDNSTLLIVVDASTRNPQIYPITVGGTAIFAEGGQPVDWQMSGINAVAYVGGIWIAAGHVEGTATQGGSINASGHALSIDSGNTWELSTYGKIGMHYDYDPETVIGAPIRDFGK